MSADDLGCSDSHPSDPGGALSYVSASRAQRLGACAILALALLYLVRFVPRGWIPHDEGMIGQTAERVLAGQWPHVGYDEPYTGALSLIYAGVFAVAGVDLLHVRRLLFVVAALAVVLMYLLARRFIAPVPAALVACTGLVWSFPNYFAGVPSWWLLACALGSLWALFRHVETGALKFAALAGLVAGFGIVIKQTGVYLLVAVILTLLYQGAAGVPLLSCVRRGAWLLRALAAVAAFAFGVLLLRSRLLPAEIVYLLAPLGLASLPLVLTDAGDAPPAALASALKTVAVGSLAGALPLALLAIAYALTGHLELFLHGAFVMPGTRLAFASKPMAPLGLLLIGLVLPIVFGTGPATATRAELLAVRVVRWALAAVLMVGSVSFVWVYQLTWQGARTLAVMLPFLVLIHVVRGSSCRRTRRQVVALSAMLAWASLVQFPFGATVYFCYVAPLTAILTAALLQRRSTGALGAPQLCALYLLFGVLVLNRGYVENLGWRHQVAALGTGLELERASLKVSEGQAEMYRAVIALIRAHLGSGTLIATPDCPEIYYLVGRFSASGEVFEFFREVPGHTQVLEQWRRATVLVVNHNPNFSPALSPDIVQIARQEFPSGKRIGSFEIRWRDVPAASVTVTATNTKSFDER